MAPMDTNVIVGPSEVGHPGAGQAGDVLIMHLVRYPGAQAGVVAVLSGGPIGELAFWTGGRSTSYVASLWVAKEHRRRGVARAMFDFVVSATALPLEHGKMRSPNGDAFATHHGPRPPTRARYTNREAEAEGAADAAGLLERVGLYAVASTHTNLPPAPARAPRSRPRTGSAARTA